MAIFRHVASGTLPGETFTFTLHTDSTQEIDAAQSAWTAAVTALWEGGTPELNTIIADTVSITQTSTALLSGSTGAQVTRRITAVNLQGTSEAEMLPFQVAEVISLRTDLATRSGRGRFYLPPLVTTSMDSGRMAASSQLILLDAASSMMSTLNTAMLEPVVYSRSTLAGTPITSIDVGDVYDTQRRRRDQLVEVRMSEAV